MSVEKTWRTAATLLYDKWSDHLLICPMMIVKQSHHLLNAYLFEFCRQNWNKKPHHYKLIIVQKQWIWFIIQKRTITSCRVILFWIKLDTLLFYSDMTSKRDYIPNREKNLIFISTTFSFRLWNEEHSHYYSVVLLIHNSSLDNDSFHPHLSRIQSKQTPAARTTIDSSILHPLLFSPFYEL